MTTFIYRDFNRKKVQDDFVLGDGFIGSILIDVMTGHRIELTVEGLQENGSHEHPIDYFYGQGNVHVKVHPDIHMYDAIVTVLDKITEDHEYMLYGQPYQDFVLCSEVFAQTHPELCNEHSSAGSYMGSAWMPFTRDTMPYVDIVDDDEQEQQTTQKNDIQEVPEAQSGGYPQYSQGRALLVQGCNLRLPTEERLEGVRRNIVLRGEVKVDHQGHPVFTYDYPIISCHMSQKYYELTRGKRVYEVTYTDLYPDGVKLNK